MSGRSERAPKSRHWLLLLMSTTILLLQPPWAATANGQAAARSPVARGGTQGEVPSPFPQPRLRAGTRTTYAAGLPVRRTFARRRAFSPLPTHANTRATTTKPHQELAHFTHGGRTRQYLPRENGRGGKRLAAGTSTRPHAGRRWAGGGGGGATTPGQCDPGASEPPRPTGRAPVACDTNRHPFTAGVRPAMVSAQGQSSGIKVRAQLLSFERDTRTTL